MGQSDTLQQAAMRLNAAVATLANSLDALSGDADTLATLTDQVRVLANERDRLLKELEAERNRAKRLEAANDEVSRRLEALMGTLRDITPIGPGGAGLEL
jgi:hypothetical protein